MVKKAMSAGKICSSARPPSTFGFGSGASSLGKLLFQMRAILGMKSTFEPVLLRFHDNVPRHFDVRKVEQRINFIRWSLHRFRAYTKSCQSTGSQKTLLEGLKRRVGRTQHRTPRSDQFIARMCFQELSNFTGSRIGSSVPCLS